MKIDKTSMRMLSVYAMLALLGGVHSNIGAQGDQIPLSFDSIFPATPYKDALGSCMQVLGYLDQLCLEHERSDEANILLLQDAFLGKVVCAQDKVAHLIADIKTGSIVADDNVHYLSTVLSYINRLYKERLNKNQHNVLATNILKNMSEQIARIGEL